MTNDISAPMGSHQTPSPVDGGTGLSSFTANLHEFRPPKESRLKRLRYAVVSAAQKNVTAVIQANGEPERGRIGLAPPRRFGADGHYPRVG
jgi:hypothetical protein